jgi:hypothetical protein
MSRWNSTEDAVTRFLTAEGSTRAMGLLRILLVLIIWNRWASDLMPVRDLSSDRLLLSAAFFLSTTWMLIGWYGQIATAATGAVLLLLVYGYGRQWGVEPWTHHHTTLLAHAAALLALTPCSTSFSLDRWLAVEQARRAGQPAPPERGPTWAISLLALQVSTVYFWSALDKSTGPFLDGTRLEQIFVEIYWTSDFTPPGWARMVFVTMAIVTVVLEYVLPFGLWVPRIRPWLVPAGLLLHALFYVLLPVGPFSVTMAAMYLAFVDQDRLHAVLDRLLGVEEPQAERAEEAA